MLPEAARPAGTASAQQAGGTARRLVNRAEQRQPAGRSVAEGSCLWSGRGLWCSESTGGSAAAGALVLLPALEQSSRGGREHRTPARTRPARAPAARGDGERGGRRADRGDGSLCSWTRSGRAQTAPALQPVLEQRKRGGRSRPSRAQARPRSGCCSPALELHARGWGRAVAGAEAGGGRSGQSARAAAGKGAERGQRALGAELLQARGDGAERRRELRPAAVGRSRALELQQGLDLDERRRADLLGLGTY